MTLIPDLERDLVHAAARASGRRRHRVALLTAAGGGAAAVAAGLALAIANDSGGPPDRGRPSTPPAATSRCAPGRSPTDMGPWRYADPRPIRSATVLGCTRLDDGRRVELVVRKLRPRGRCLDIHVLGGGAVLTCAADPAPTVSGRPIGLSTYAPPGNALGGALIVGWTASNVARVELVFRSGRAERRTDVPLIRVDTVPLVLTAGEHMPFGVFAFNPPRGMEASRVAALGPRGKRLGSATIPKALRPGR